MPSSRLCGTIFVSVALSFSASIPALGQDATLQWVGVGSSEPSVCAFSDISEGQMVQVRSDFMTSDPDFAFGAVPAFVSIETTNISEINVDHAPVLTTLSSGDVTILNLVYTGSQLIGATHPDTEFFALTFPNGGLIDTPDSGSDNFTLSLSGDVFIDAFIDGETYSVDHFLTCVISAS